jgi:hypothetical protein
VKILIPAPIKIVAIPIPLIHPGKLKPIIGDKKGITKINIPIYSTGDALLKNICPFFIFPNLLFLKNK